MPGTPQLQNSFLSHLFSSMWQLVPASLLQPNQVCNLVRMSRLPGLLPCSILGEQQAMVNLFAFVASGLGG